VLSPFGTRVHAPWAMAVTAMLRDERGLDAEVMWSDDGFVVRVPEGDRPIDPALLVPDPDDVERLVVRQLGATAMFAARFREAAGRALLLPRRRPGARAPLWQQRKRAADLLAVAAKFGSFPIVLEAYRECLRDIFDLPALVDLLTRIRSRTVRVVTVEARASSPFAASLLFGYVANYLYDGDAPLAERRAQALSVDQAQLADLIGEGELRTLVDPDALATLEYEAQQLPERYHARSADAVHDLLLRLGRKEEAMASYERAVALAEEARTVNPGDALNLASLAVYVAKVGRTDAARRYAVEATRRAPDDQAVWSRAAQVYAILGRADDALAALTRAIDLKYPKADAAQEEEFASLRALAGFRRLIGE